MFELQQRLIEGWKAAPREPVTGAPANELEGIVPDEVKDERFARLIP